ncbi:hypothetical protein BGX28_006601 [Mortierella sp. GBA30]|nr:hypothetical protein BGX28_006601 [Mortierella sp. GBA30]
MNATALESSGTSSATKLPQSPQDITDYQMQVSDQDRNVVNTILTELSTTCTYRNNTAPETDALITEDSQRCSDRCEPEAILETSSDRGPRAADAIIMTKHSNDVNAGDLALETGLATTMQALSVVPSPTIDAGETKRFVKRSHALQELETTEESYVNDLDILIHVCKLDDSDRERHAPLRVYKNLAGCFEILNHDNYLYGTFCELRMRIVNEINRSANQTAMALLQRESNELLTQQGRPKTRADLKDCLIKPIQRICRYPLLLKEIQRLTSLYDPEYQYIEQAYKLMKGMAQEMDETQRVVERKLLTEQFLRKLPETSFPRRVSSTPSREHLNINTGNNHGISSNSNSLGVHTLATSRSFHGNTASTGASQSSCLPLDTHFDLSSTDGIPPGPLTKAYAGTLGSIVLAGALEYVMIPDMPIRLKYYGCFLFETMLIIVKAKKSSLYEPRQWLPLRLCELHETTRLDGYTRFGWRIMFDQFRIDFGASCVAEQQVWMSTLQDRIQTAKSAYNKLPRDIAAFETIISSLPWNMNIGTGGSSKAASSSLGYTSARHLQIIQQSPSPSPSPWSSCSSAIPSPLMPPPPAHSASSTTMMMAMSSLVPGQPEKWNANTRSKCSSLEGYFNTHHDQHVHSHPERTPEYQSATDTVTTVGGSSMYKIGGMAGSESMQEHDPSEQRQGLQRYGPRDQHPCQQQQQQQLERQERPSNLLQPSTPVPWLLSDTTRPARNHSFDVTRVFTSSHSGGIKPTHRTMVQSMFKDVSTENIWTTSTSSQPIPQAASSAMSPLTRRSSNRYGSSIPFDYFGSTRTATSATGGMMATTTMTTIPGDREDEDVPASAPTIYSLASSGSSSTSLTNRFLRRRNSGGADRPFNNSPGSHQDKKDGERRRSSATATIAATLTLNFRKNLDGCHNQSQTSAQDSHKDEDNSGVYQRISVKARAQLFEKRASASSSQHQGYPDNGSSILPTSQTFQGRHDTKKIKMSQSLQDLGSFRARDRAMESPRLTTTKTLFSSRNDANSNTLDALSSAAEAARSRRVVMRTGSEGNLRACSSTLSLPLVLGSKNSSTQSLVLPPSPSADALRENLDKLWVAMGRLTHKRCSSKGIYDRDGSRNNIKKGHVSLPALPRRHDSSRSSSSHEGAMHSQEHDTHVQGAITAENTTTPTSSILQSTTSPAVYSNHVRTSSVGTDQSTDSEKSRATIGTVSGGNNKTLKGGARLNLTPSVSNVSYSSTSSRSSLYSITPSILDDHSGQGREHRDGSTKSSPRKIMSFHDGYLQDEQRSTSEGEKVAGLNVAMMTTTAMTTSTTASPHAMSASAREQRRRSLSILHSITHSASQKFKTLIRSPSTLRRKTVMNLSPIMMESQSPNAAEGVLVEEDQEKRERDA